MFSTTFRHAEQHFFCPTLNGKEPLVICVYKKVLLYERLFHFCAEIEANEFISGHVDSNTITREHVTFAKISKAMSAEAMYRQLLAEWEKDSTPFEALLTKYNGSCSSEWCDHISRDVNDAILSKESIGDMVWKLIERDVDRLLVMARESLSAQGLDTSKTSTKHHRRCIWQSKVFHQVFSLLEMRSNVSLLKCCERTLSSRSF